MPQWNCACANCAAARRGAIPARTQSSIAIGGESGDWLLVNASPDLRVQIESFPALHPGGASARSSPVRDVLLTNADLDHVLGLFLLREHGQTVRVHCTRSVRETLSGALRLDAVLGAYCGIEWHELPETGAPFSIGGKSGRLTCRAIPLPGEPPRYAAAPGPSGGQSVALEFVDGKSGASLVVAPDVSAVTPELHAALADADAVLFDGTFWSDDELRRTAPAARTASQMGHLPISQGSLGLLRELPARHRIYTHINNTNPILAPGSPERVEVESAGVAIGEDGTEFQL